MKATKKSFDCVEMMHKGALRIHEELKGMTQDEKLAYWRRKNAEIARKYPHMRVIRAPERERK